MMKSCRCPGARQASGAALFSYSVAVCRSVCSSAWRSENSLLVQSTQANSRLCRARQHLDSDVDCVLGAVISKRYVRAESFSQVYGSKRHGKLQQAINAWR